MEITIRTTNRQHFDENERPDESEFVPVWKIEANTQRARQDG